MLTPEIIRHDLNWSDLSALHRNRHYLTPLQAYLLCETQRRMQLHPQRYARPSQRYSATSGLILMSDWDHRVRFCQCGVAKQSCKLWKFCPACAYAEQQKLLCTFLTQFEDDSFYSFTGSYHGEHEFECPQPEDLRVYWDAYNTALRLWLKAGLILGAVWGEEFHIVSLYPQVRVLLHVQGFLHAKSLTMKSIFWLWNAVEYYQGPEIDERTQSFRLRDQLRVRLTPSTSTKPLRTESDYAQVISYSRKSIDLVRPYEAAFATAREAGDIIFLNQNLNEFLNGHLNITYRRIQSHRCGTLDARCRDRFVGVKKRQRCTTSHKRHIRELLKEHVVERAMARAVPDPLPNTISIEEDWLKSIANKD